MTKIDIDKLSEAELIDLNHRIVERLRFLSQMRAHSQMLDFKIGDSTGTLRRDYCAPPSRASAVSPATRKLFG
jgi:hypothetical protein